MAGTWADSGLDLHLDLTARRGAGSLADSLRSGIREGRLRGGTRLPASRALARDLGIARNTVAEAYGRLAAEGWLETRVGSGTWVSARPTRVVTPEPPAPPAAAFLDLRGGIPDATSFPRAEWASAARRALGAVPGGTFRYADPLGSPRLRRVLAEYLARARGVWADGEEVMVTHGFGELLAIVCRALAGEGVRRIAVEAWGHEQHRRIIAASGLELVPLPVDEDGAVVSALDGLDAGAVLLTPAHQFPLGVALTAQRRLEVVAWAERVGGLIIEDDYDGEFRYDRRSVGALQALAPQSVLYAGTASKSLAPAVGLAWGVAPARWLPPLRAQRLLGGGGADTLNQLTLAEFIESLGYDRHLRQLRARYRRRRESVEESFAEGGRVTGLRAGLQCVLELPAGTSEDAVVASAAARGLRVQGLASFAIVGVETGAPPAIVVGYGAPAEYEFPRAVELLAAAIADTERPLS